jgi:hypothetical protein
MVTFRFVKLSTLFKHLLLAVFSCSIIITAIYYSEESINFKISFISILILSFFIPIFLNYCRKIVIDNICIKYKSFVREEIILWDDVKEVGITTFAPFPVANTADFIYFSTEKGIPKLIHDIKLTNSFIFLRYRKTLIPIIEEYWKSEIK